MRRPHPPLRTDWLPDSLLVIVSSRTAGCYTSSPAGPRPGWHTLLTSGTSCSTCA